MGLPCLQNRAPTKRLLKYQSPNHKVYFFFLTAKSKINKHT